MINMIQIIVGLVFLMLLFGAADKFPQWLNLTTTIQTVATDYKESETKVPVRIQALEVMEILGVEYEIVGAAMNGKDADFTNNILMHLASDSRSTIIDLTSSKCLDKHGQIVSGQAMEVTETGAAGYAYKSIVWHSFAAGGKGFLYGQDQIFLGIDQDTIAQNLLTVRARVLYRLVKVTATELVGIVKQ